MSKIDYRLFDLIFAKENLSLYIFPLSLFTLWEFQRVVFSTNGTEGKKIICDPDDCYEYSQYV